MSDFSNLSKLCNLSNLHDLSKLSYLSTLSNFSQSINCSKLSNFSKLSFSKIRAFSINWFARYVFGICNFSLCVQHFRCGEKHDLYNRIFYRGRRCKETTLTVARISLCIFTIKAKILLKFSYLVGTRKLEVMGTITW